jgi:hypothetical protein
MTTGTSEENTQLAVLDPASSARVLPVAPRLSAAPSSQTPSHRPPAHHLVKPMPRPHRRGPDRARHRHSTAHG